MGKLITQDELNKILKKASDQGLREDEVVQELINQNHKIEGLEAPKTTEFNMDILTQEKDKNLLQRISEVAIAPAKVASGLIGKAVSKIPGPIGDIAERTESVQELPQSIEQAGQFAKVALPVAAGFATSGASLVPMLGSSFSAGSLGSFIEDLTDEDRKDFSDILIDSMKEGGIDALIDTVFLGSSKGIKALRGLKKVKPLDESVDKIVGRITQAKKPKDITKAKKALSLIDTSDVKTFKELQGLSKDKISSIANIQDNLIAPVSKSKKLGEFTELVTTKTDIAGKTVKKSGKQNAVAEAMDHLEELYRTTGDTQDLLRIQSIKEVAENEGLNAIDLNKIAREYGQEFGEKAFSRATGEPLTSVNAKKFEGTRMRLKGSVRKMIGSLGQRTADSFDALDKEMSSLFTLKKLSTKMDESARNLTNKIEDRGLISKVFNKIGGGIDLVFGRAPSSFFTSLFVRGNIGQKQLNSLQLQDNLAKNLKMLNKLTNQIDGVSDDIAADIITDFVKKNFSNDLKIILKTTIDAE